MTTLAEIKETETLAETYKPTVHDKIQRVIYRLESGEELIAGALSCDGKFCVLGMFLDEAGLVGYASLLNNYKLKRGIGEFNLNEAPENVKRAVSEFNLPHKLDLMFINDKLIEHGIKPNQILADIIRSGIVFDC